MNHQCPSPKHFLTLLYSSPHTSTEVHPKINLASFFSQSLCGYSQNFATRRLGISRIDLLMINLQ